MAAKGVRGMSKELRVVAEQALAHGWTIRLTGGGHYRWQSRAEAAGFTGDMAAS